MVINELFQPQHQNEAQRFCHTLFLDSRGAVDQQWTYNSQSLSNTSYCMYTWWQSDIQDSAHYDQTAKRLIFCIRLIRLFTSVCNSVRRPCPRVVKSFWAEAASTWSIRVYGSQVTLAAFWGARESAVLA